jgi:hypothetical protein
MIGLCALCDITRTRLAALGTTDAEALSRPGRIPPTSNVHEIVVDVERGRAFTLDVKSGITIWDLTTGRPGALLTRPGWNGWHRKLVVDPNGQHLLVCGHGRENSVHVWT